MVEVICALLSNMADLNSSRQLIGREGGVAEVVKHLKGTNSVRAAAVHCLSCLLQDSPANCKWVVNSIPGALLMVCTLPGSVLKLMESRHW